ncbi:MAG TPA: YidC/Oxa1 family membrane protein insertase [Acidimicrobiales bacterium]|nr:YidC/Oxa1 family membrane protein insertase [Acidimicrobiales bacterium]
MPVLTATMPVLTASMRVLTASMVLAAKSFWILDPLYTALGTVLAWFYDVIPSYGMAIILLTLAVRLLTFPLTAKQARSQQQLQKLQPELKRLQAKYKGDKQKLNEEMMKFYKDNHVNPFGGCLPLFIQFPVLIVLYRLILGLTRTFIIGFAVVVGAAVAVGGAPAGPLEGVTVQNGHVSSGSVSKGVVTKGNLDEAQAVVNGKVVGTVTDAKIVNGKIASAKVMNGKVLVGTMTDLTVTGGQVAGSPKNVPDSSSLFRALKASGGKMESWGMDLAKRASDTSGSEQVPFVILVVLVGATGYYQQRQLTGRLPKESANSQMAVMGKVFPLIFVFISWTIPAGVVVYFLVSNIWQIGQQAYMFRNQPKPEAGSKTEGKAPKGPTPTVGKGKAKPANGPKSAKGLTGGRLSKGATAKNAKNVKNAKGAKKVTGSGTAGNRGQRKTAANNGNKRGQDRSAQPPRGRTLRSGQVARPDSKKAATQSAAEKSPGRADDSTSKAQGTNGSAPLATPTPPAAGDRDKDTE